MCGIAGVFLFRDQGSKIKREELLAARDRMHSRGPDDCGLWMSDSTEIALAHRRLSILDLSEAGRQPMARDGGRLQICYNGEVYNFKELRSELKGKGHSFRSDTDTEVLLAMYREYGPEFVVKLRGMFAIAIWDDDRKTLSLARDPFGIKPLYFSLHANGIYFASQVRALLAFSAIDRELDPIGQCGFFLLGSVPEPHTLFRAIRQLAPGSVMEVSAERGPKIVYEVDVEHLCADASVARQGEARASVDFNAALEQSVAAHLVSDAPIGFFLSAGLDSTALVSCARSLGHTDIRTVTLGFDALRTTSDDETILAEKTARHYGTNHQTVWVTEADFTSHLDDFLSVMDQPTIDACNTYFVSLAARQAGLKVALSGLGADELLGGYPSFVDVPKSVALNSYLSFLPGAALRRLASHFMPPKHASVLEYGRSYMGSYLLRRGLYMPWELRDLLSEEIVESGWPIFEQRLLSDERLAHWQTDFQRVSIAELTWYMRNQLLRDTDWASMAHSLEVRVPFVDREVTAAVFRQSMRTPFTKLDMVSSLRRPALPEVVHRKKTGFWVPIRQWLRSIDPQRAEKRGLRGWAEVVYERYLESCGVTPE